MAAILASLQSTCSSQHLRNQQLLRRPNRSSIAKTRSPIATGDTDGQRKLNRPEWVSADEQEARRRKHLELYPEPATNEDPVHFNSIIPWWAWLFRFHLPEAELLNGRAAMVGFFMAYFVDGLTGLGLVDQTNSFLCKTFFFVIVAAILVFWQTNDLRILKWLIKEATFYDKQWQATWQDQNTPKSSEKD